MTEDAAEQQAERPDSSPAAEASTRQDGAVCFYRIRCRPQGQDQAARSAVPDLSPGEVVLFRTEDRLEPAVIVCRVALPGAGKACDQACEIIRRANVEEKERHSQLSAREQTAAAFCKVRIRALALPMHLVRAERHFNGSKVVFYFTAESRIDFRELVKDLVQEFRTRVEMRQIGVRHETQMTGGIGACGRELCCSSFLRNFESVSIRMAKAQDLPLNPAKISGVCNRLLCCLTYEFESYQAIKREMPRVGRQLTHEGTIYRVTRIFPMQGTVLAVSPEGTEVTLTEAQWREAARPAPPPPVQARKKSKSTGKKDVPQNKKKG